MKTRMKLLSILLAIVMVFTLVPISGIRIHASTVVDSGTCGVDASWSLSYNGIITISGTGAMQDYEAYNDMPWYKYKDSILSVVIEDGITRTGKMSFYQMENLSNVSLPNSLITLGDGTFSGCTSLTNVILPSNLVKIGASAFGKCKLESIEFPASVKTIGGGAFYENNLISVIVPNTVEDIGDSAFAGCEKLEKAAMLSKNKTEWARHGDHIFADCISLKMVIWDDAKIPVNTFGRCESLTEFYVPKDCTFIGTRAFRFCKNLRRIYIPKTVTELGSGLFQDDDNFSEIFYEGSEEDWNKINIETTYDNSKLNEAVKHFNTSYDTLTLEDLFVNEPDGHLDYAGYQVDFKPTILANSSMDGYNKELSEVCALLSEAAYSDKGVDVDLLLKKMGISYYENDYSKGKLCYTVASDVLQINGIDTNVVFIVLRGTNNIDELLGDHFTVADKEVMGFPLYGLVREFSENIIEKDDNQKVFFEGTTHQLTLERNDESDYWKATANNGKPIKIIITGHSLGGATANYLGALFNQSTRFSYTNYQKDDIYVYTYGSIDCICEQNDYATVAFRYENIHNIYNFYDSFGPHGWPEEFSANGRTGYGKFGHIDIFSHAIDDEPTEFENHKMKPTYIPAVFEGWVEHNYNRRVVTIQCPVNVCAFKDGVLISRIVDNVVDDSLNGIPTKVIGDEKYFLIDDESNYSFEITATDTGTMKYCVYDAVTGNTSKAFSSVFLETGKKFVSDITKETEIEDVELNVVDDEGILISTVDVDGTETPVEYTVSFDAGEGTGSMDSEEVVYGTEYELPDSDFIAPIGKDFDKWDKGDVGEKITIQGDVTATALWKDHELTHFEQVDATCIDAGTEEYWECTNCGKLFSDDAGTVEITEPVTIPIDEDAHDWGEWTETLAPTETEKGEEKRICKNNSEHYETREVPELGHEHVLTKVTKNEATCEKDGNIEYWECSGCHRLFSDSSAENSIEKEDTILEAKGHTSGKAVKENEIAATKEKDGSYDEVVYCEDCGKELERNEKIIEKLSSEDDDKDEKDNKQDDDKKDNKENENNEDVTIPEVPKDWLDPLNEMLNIAASLGGEQIVEISGDYALPYDIMNFLQQHPQITLIYHVTYQGETYTVTIPGSKAIVDDNIPWYGPLLLNAYYNGALPIGVGGTYVVKAGDTLSALSDRLGVKIQALIDKNGIINPNLIYEGQIIIY